MIVAPKTPTPAELRQLTKQEISAQETAILQLAADGFSCVQTGITLGLMPSTVKNYRKRISAKLGADSTLHAVAQAFRRGLIA
jgi:DNA-binding CsgD family transcriptional regulator